MGHGTWVSPTSTYLMTAQNVEYRVLGLRVSATGFVPRRRRLPVTTTVFALSLSHTNHPQTTPRQTVYPPGTRISSYSPQRKKVSDPTALCIATPHSVLCITSRFDCLKRIPASLSLALNHLCWLSLPLAKVDKWSGAQASRQQACRGGRHVLLPIQHEWCEGRSDARISQQHRQLTCLTKIFGRAVTSSHRVMRTLHMIHTQSMCR